MARRSKQAGRIFGLTPAERLHRQGARDDGQSLFLATPYAVLGDSAIGWLRGNPGTMLTTPTGAALAIVVPAGERAQAEQALSEGGGAYPTAMSGVGPDIFNRKLRRREKLFGLSLVETPASAVERALFDSVYKGVTDVVTKYVWPLPALWLTRRLAAMRVPPNAVTLVGMVLVFVAAYFFYVGALGPALAAAWLMTFLDTVDGKLARVTATSSKLGDILDHGTDLIHPPLWWICLAIGLRDEGSRAGVSVWPACIAILLAYVLGRLVEGGFKKALGFNQYIWRPFDSGFRLIVARRNTILLIMTIGVAAPIVAYLAAAAWSVVSVLIQIVRFAQGLAARPIEPWLAQSASEIATNRAGPV